MRLFVILGVLALGACVRSIDTPAITGFNGDMVVMQGAGFGSGSQPLPEHTEAAQGLCQSKGKDAQFASSRAVGDVRVEYTFLCL
jgi:hypothetical protein